MNRIVLGLFYVYQPPFRWHFNRCWQIQMKQPRYFEVKIISRLLRNPALHSVGFNDFYHNYLPNWVELEFFALIFFGLSSFIHQNIHLSAESVYFVNLGLSFCKLRNKSSEYPIFIKLNFIVCNYSWHNFNNFWQAIYRHQGWVLVRQKKTMSDKIGFVIWNIIWMFESS